MQIVSSIDDLRAAVADYRADGERVGFVPTMGNLHAGHLSLVAEARALAGRTVVSIFVNPLQFGANEDLSRYPRTPQEDRAALREAGVDLLFMPEVDAIYPRPLESMCAVEVPGISDILCGASRPGHFRGVTTVVAKLFNLVQPDVAIFGLKDYQQLAIIRRMVDDLAIPVAIASVETAREPSGLALSSRNTYLSPEQREQAAGIFQILQSIGAALRRGECDFSLLEARGREALAKAGLKPDYLAIRRQGNLDAPAVDDSELVVLAAAYLGSTRLIDNILISK